MMPISDDNGDAVASSSQQLPTSPPSNLGRPSLSSVSSLAPNWLQNGFTRHRKRSSWKFKGRGSLCFLTSVLLVLSILPLIGNFTYIWQCINYSKLIAIRRISNYCLAFDESKLFVELANTCFCRKKFFLRQRHGKIKIHSPISLFMKSN